VLAMIDAIVVADQNFISLLSNNLLHASSALPELRIIAHCLDAATHAACERVISGDGSRHICVRATLVLQTLYNVKGTIITMAKELRKEAVLLYKLRAVRNHLSQSRHFEVMLLDADAMILTSGCLAAWRSAEEDIITQIGGCPGCTSASCARLGVAANTGMMIVRQTSLPWLTRLLNHRYNRTEPFGYDSHCYEQALFNQHVANSGPRWLAFPHVLEMRSAQRSAGPEASLSAVHSPRPLRLRLLNHSEWPASPSIGAIHVWPALCPSRTEWRHESQLDSVSGQSPPYADAASGRRAALSHEVGGRLGSPRTLAIDPSSTPTSTPKQPLAANLLANLVLRTTYECPVLDEDAPVLAAGTDPNLVLNPAVLRRALAGLHESGQYAASRLLPPSEWSQHLGVRSRAHVEWVEPRASSSVSSASSTPPSSAADPPRARLLSFVFETKAPPHQSDPSSAASDNFKSLFRQRFHGIRMYAGGIAWSHARRRRSHGPFNATCSLHTVGGLAEKGETWWRTAGLWHVGVGNITGGAL